MHKFLNIIRKVGNWFSFRKMVVVGVMVMGMVGMPSHYIDAYFCTSISNCLGNAIGTEIVESTSDALDNVGKVAFATPFLVLAAIVNVMGMLMGLLGLLLITILMPILQYNGFFTSTITNLGWSLVRDTTNMFVVAILILVACMTIVGYAKANWMQQLPRLFLAVVFVNFSKLICGVLIDVSQVILFTFVNAIVSIAAGNFASMFNLQNWGGFDFSFIDSVTSSEFGVGGPKYLMGSVLDLMMSMSVFAVMLMLTVAFLWRIVVLWLLIIMSPLAFFAWGVGDLIHFAGKISSDWWGKMVSALTFGPIMVFFLWLALAASSGANIASNEGFDTQSAPPDLGIPNATFSPTNFLGSLMAFVILIAGMQQASSAAAAMGGFASTALSPSTLKKGVKAVGRGAFVGAKAVATGGKDQKEWMNKKATSAGVALAAVNPKLAKGLGTQMANAGISLSAGNKLTNSKVGKFFGMDSLASVAGVAVGAAGNNVYSGQETANKEKLKKAGEENEKMTPEQKKMMLRGRGDAAAGRNTEAAKFFKSQPKDQRDADTANLVKTEKAQKKLRKELEDRAKADGRTPEDAQEEFNAIAGKAFAFASTDEGASELGLDSAAKDSVEDGLTANLHLIQPEGGREKYRTPDGKAWNSSTAEADYNTAQEVAIVKHLNKMKDAGRLKHGAISAASIKNDNVRAATQKFDLELGKDGKPVKLLDKIIREGTSDQKQAVVSMIKASDITGPAARDNINQLVNAGAVGTVANRNKPGGPTSAIGDRMDAVRTHLQTPTALATPSKAYGAATAALLDSEYSPSEVFGAGFPPTDADGLPTVASTPAVRSAAITPALKSRVPAMLQTSTTSARHLSAFVGPVVENKADRAEENRKNAEQANDITESIATAMTPEKIRQLSADNVSSDDRKKNDDTLAVAARAVQIQHAKAVVEGRKDDAKRLTDKGEELGLALKYPAPVSTAVRPARPVPIPIPVPAPIVPPVLPTPPTP